MLKIGLRSEYKKQVTAGDTAVSAGSGDLEVLATPVMVAAMEHAAKDCVSGELSEGELSEGETTVGTSLSIKHLSATPVGAYVRAEAELTEIDRKRLVFAVKAYDGDGLIGEGVHERFIVDSRKFMEKAGAKKHG